MQSLVKHWLIQESMSFLRVETVEKPTTVYDNKTITDVVKLVGEQLLLGLWLCVCSEQHSLAPAFRDVSPPVTGEEQREG